MILLYRMIYHSDMTEQEFYAHLERLMPFGVYDKNISTLCDELNLTVPEVARFLTCIQKYMLRFYFPQDDKEGEVWIEKA